MVLDYTFDKVTNIINHTLLVIVTILMNLFMIMFIYRLYKKAQNFTSAYFRLLIIESLVNGILVYNFYVLGLFEDIQRIGSVQFWSLFGRWYQYRFYGLCNLLLVLNRFTGVFFWKQHSKIWNGRIFYFFILFLFLYPFILSGYDLRNAGICIDIFFYQKDFLQEPQKYVTCIFTFHNMNGVPIQVTISNVTNAALGLGLGIATALARHIKKCQTKQKYENRLLMQSIFTSVLFVLFEIFTFIHGIVGATYTGNWEILINDQSNHNWSRVLECIISCTRVLFSCSSGIILFIMSEGVRSSFISFYRLPTLRNNSTSVTVISPTDK